MSGKFMKIKKIIIPTITMVIIASQLFGCSCSTQDELNKMINNNEQIVIEVAEPDFEEQGTESQLVWTPLAELTNYSSFREGFDKVFGVEQSAYTKAGVLYIDNQGNSNGNNTLYNVFTNKNFVENYWNNEETQDAISSLAVELYADVDENSTDTLYASINAYFNLLADNEVNYYNGQASLTRAEAMTMLMRAVTPVEDLKSNSEFTEAVGKSEYTDYASYVSDDSYLTTADKSLNNQTFNGTITRGEFVYMVVSSIFGSDIISNTDISNISLKDCKATTKTYDYKEKSYVKSYDLNYAIQSPDDGAPADLYKALAVANKLEVIGSETRWDEALTKSEAIEIIIDAILAHNNLNGYTTEVDAGNSLGETYKEQAQTKYDSLQNEISCEKDTYISDYIELIDAGKTVEEVEKILYEKYENTENNGSGQKAEVPTVTPDEQVEQVEILVTDEIKDEAFSGNFEIWYQTRDGVFIYKQSPGVIYYWGSDMSVIKWDNPIDANRLIPTEELVSISTGTKVESSITSGTTNSGNSNTSSTEETETSSKPTFDGSVSTIDPNGKGDPSLWEGIIFNP